MFLPEETVIKRKIYKVFSYFVAVLAIALSLLMIFFSEKIDTAISETVLPDDGKIMIPDCKNLSAKCNSDKIDVDFYNPENNNCYLKVTVILSETSEIIYESTVVSPGERVNSVRMSKIFSKPGIYDIKIKIDAYRIDTFSYLNGILFSEKLEVKK